MPINSLESAKLYTSELDKKLMQKSATAFFADNNFAAKFVGAKTVIIPDIDFQGLTDYDRDTGFTRGAINVSNTPYTMKMDRARSLQIDREDMDETGIANLAGKILGEYVRTKVVPECDAYVLSKLGGLAITRDNLVEGETSKPFEALCKLINEVQSVAGYDEELVAFLDSGMYATLCNSNEIARMITVSDFKQGEINLKVKSFNGIALLPVVSERMKTGYQFDLEGGGFKPLPNAKQIYMLVCPKSAVHLVKKSETMRIFAPGQNIDADAYKFDYRIYYDVFVQKSGLDSVWAWVSNEVTVSAQPEDIEVTEGAINGSLSVTATVSSGKLSYQWYSANDKDGNGAVKVKGGRTNTLSIPTDLEAGTYYYFAKIKVDGIDACNTNVATVTVK